MEKIKFTKAYLTELASEVAGWFVGGTLAALALDSLSVAELGNVEYWKAGLAMGAIGVIKGLAAKFVGDPQSTSLRRD